MSKVSYSAVLVKNLTITPMDQSSDRGGDGGRRADQSQGQSSNPVTCPTLQTSGGRSNIRRSGDLAMTRVSDASLSSHASLSPESSKALTVMERPGLGKEGNKVRVRVNHILVNRAERSLHQYVDLDSLQWCVVIEVETELLFLHFVAQHLHFSAVDIYAMMFSEVIELLVEQERIAAQGFVHQHNCNVCHLTRLYAQAESSS